jgi:hypothetical protein
VADGAIAEEKSFDVGKPVQLAWCWSQFKGELPQSDTERETLSLMAAAKATPPIEAQTSHGAVESVGVNEHGAKQPMQAIDAMPPNDPQVTPAEKAEGGMAMDKELIEKLKRLSDLGSKGALTDIEFAELKHKLLNANISDISDKTRNILSPNAASKFTNDEENIYKEHQESSSPLDDAAKKEETVPKLETFQTAMSPRNMDITYGEFIKTDFVRDALVSNVEWFRDAWRKLINSENIVNCKLSDANADIKIKSLASFRSTTFSWDTFVFGTMWAVYRQCWLWIPIYLIQICIGVAAIFEYWGAVYLSWVVGAVISFVFGLFGYNMCLISIRDAYINNRSAKSCRPSWWRLVICFFVPWLVLGVIVLAMMSGGDRVSCSNPDVVNTLRGILAQQFEADLRLMIMSGPHPTVDLTNIRTTDPNSPHNGATCVATMVATRDPAAVKAAMERWVLEVPYTVQNTDDGKGFVVYYQK